MGRFEGWLLCPIDTVLYSYQCKYAVACVAAMVDSIKTVAVPMASLPLCQMVISRARHSIIYIGI